jgi:hypothetical protein
METENNKKRKGCSIQHKNKTVAKKVHERKVAVRNQGTIGMSSMGHAKKELTESQKAFFGRQ